MTTLAVWADLKVPAVLAAVPGVKARVGERDGSDDVLYDAPDLRLLRSGVQVRRVDDAWHVRVAPSPWWHADCGDRAVLHVEPVVDDRSPEVVAGLLRGAKLSAAVTVRDRRRSWHAVLAPAAPPARSEAPHAADDDDAEADDAEAAP